MSGVGFGKKFMKSSILSHTLTNQMHLRNLQRDRQGDSPGIYGMLSLILEVVQCFGYSPALHKFIYKWTHLKQSNGGELNSLCCAKK